MSTHSHKWICLVSSYKTLSERVKNNSSQLPNKFLYRYPTHVRWIPLSQWHGMSLGCEWRKQPPDMEGSC
jgi:hypothetical protein